MRRPKKENDPTEPEPILREIPTALPPESRRGFLGFIGKLGIVSVGAVAGVAELQRPARASTTVGRYICCDLWFGHPTCPIDKNGYPFCSKGTMRTWCCCSGGRTYACGECVGSSSCENGPFYCSAIWTTAPNKCVSGCSSAAMTAEPAYLAAWQANPWVGNTTPHYGVKARATP